MVDLVVIRENPCGLLKGFIDPRCCSESIGQIRSWAGSNPPLRLKEEPDRTSQNFWSMDILPRAVQTDRIMRDFLLGDLKSHPQLFPNLLTIFGKLNKFHAERIIAQVPSSCKEYVYAPQVLHYPEGGGFFDWHTHPRKPQNYGLLLMLDDGIEGNTWQDLQLSGSSMAVECENTIVSTQGIMKPGDLFVFRYDLKHCILPHMHGKDLNLTRGGAYYAVNPLMKPANTTT